MSGVNRIALTGILVILGCASALVGAACAEENGWQTDFEAAKGKAKSEKKLLLVNFTGSDWCGWCIRLKKEVFDEEAFQKDAPKQFVLVELDYPRSKKLPDELKTQNEKLSEQYEIRGFPTVLVLDADGQPIARTGYRDGGAEAYVEHLGEIVTAHETIVAMKGKLEKVQGIDRAKLLDQLIDAYAKLDNEVEELDAWTKEIISLDADNKAGLKLKYQFKQLVAEADELKENEKYDEAKAALDKALALPGLTGEQKQEAYFAQGECFFHAKDFVGIVAALKKGLEAAPEGPSAPMIKRTLERFSAAAEAQEAVAKIDAELETAKGLDRAKALDRLIDAREKLSRFARDGNLSEQVEKWAQEIVALDAENKAGLKRKYEFRVALAEAERLSRGGNRKEAQASLDKALSLSGLEGEQVQELQFLKATCYLSEQDFQKGLDCFKKALEAAPEGAKATVIKAMVRRCELALERQKPKEDKPAKEKPNKQKEKEKPAAKS